MRFEILGPQRAWQDSQELDLGPGKQRAVLTVLLLHAGRPVPTTRIVDAVWAEDPPANGPNVVQKYVAGLRRVLEPDRSPRTPGQVLSLTDAGYLLRVGTDELDLLRFEQRTRRAQVARAEGRSAEAVDELRAALDLWRGDPLEGLVGSFFDSARHRLVDMRTAALETWAELELELGRHQELVGELGRLVARFPVRERLRYLLMLALYRAGRQAEALTSFREIRSLLRDEHGLEPGEQLQELHRRILRSDPTLTLPARSGPEPEVVVPAQPGPEPEAVVPVPGVSNPEAVVPAPGVPEPEVGVPVPVPGPEAVVPVPVPVPGPEVVVPVPVPGPEAVVPVPVPMSGGVPPLGSGPPFPLPPLTTAHGQRRAWPLWVSHLGTVLAVLSVVLSLGSFTWLVMFSYAVRRRSWLLGASGVGYLAVAVVFCVALGSMDPDPEALPTDAETAGIFAGLLLGWLGGAVHVILINRAVLAMFGGRLVAPAERVGADQRVRREQARYLLYHYPTARADLRIGRPDLPNGFDDGGLVDINSVGEQVIVGLPGLPAEQGRQIVLDRWLRGPYASLEELVARCLLPMDVADFLRDILLFLPPSGSGPPFGQSTPPFGQSTPPAFPTGRAGPG
ncbi:winged helix-turn-helix domain-containing protein [Plantactinospora sp. S1510]|uniref:Winged helix-turn-helix domain-containing protein n=1 Tax=Plantactinospora alkalitolerans TaxID=2789879 RepID=A0ABS0H7T6_9ACTN|nr:BTAD domain-containing putative transcriptional regulator [Plantactinospora alkalitolerans]MBF9134356.1 winged helix-turn-helix domain-containing protein [Plantactinospora alkalitolerans]